MDSRRGKGKLLPRIKRSATSSCSRKHLFVELHELRGPTPSGTRRKDIPYVARGRTRSRAWERKWLPKALTVHLDFRTMLAFRDCLHEDLVILEAWVARTTTVDERARTEAVDRLWNILITDGALHEQDRDGALRTLTNHLNRRKCVEHDDELKALKEKERKLREAEKEGELQKLPRGPLETLGEDDEVASQSSTVAFT